jgi:hypothetical protein
MRLDASHVENGNNELAKQKKVMYDNKGITVEYNIILFTTVGG